MTQVFDEKGVVSAATIITAGPLTVTQVKGKEKEGYEAAQVGFGFRKEKNTMPKRRPVILDRISDWLNRSMQNCNAIHQQD